MFGQVPRLPIHFLLAVTGWGNIGTHRDTLRATYKRAQARLNRAAELRKKRHDHVMRGIALQEGQEDYLRDNGIRGPHKIQNHWSSVVYRVVRDPRGDGGV